jgi:hypothetical protein
MDLFQLEEKQLVFLGGAGDGPGLSLSSNPGAQISQRLRRIERIFQTEPVPILSLISSSGLRRL